MVVGKNFTTIDNEKMMGKTLDVNMSIRDDISPPTRSNYECLNLST